MLKLLVETLVEVLWLQYDRHQDRSTGKLKDEDNVLR
jgi:hypothetical protein